MPTIDLTDDEHAAVTALIKRAIDQDRFPRAPRASTRCAEPWRSRSRSCSRAQAAARRESKTRQEARRAALRGQYGKGRAERPPAPAMAIHSLSSILLKRPSPS
jgi:hypothetical protein